MRKPKDVPASPEDFDAPDSPPGGHAARRLAEFLDARFPDGRPDEPPEPSPDEPSAENDEPARDS